MIQYSLSPISCGDFQDVPALDSEQSPVKKKEERAVEGQEIGVSKRRRSVSSLVQSKDV